MNFNQLVELRPLHLDKDDLLNICNLKTTGKRGEERITAHQFNCSQILRRHPHFRGRFQFDEFSHTIYHNYTEPTQYAENEQGLLIGSSEQAEDWKELEEIVVFQFIDWCIDHYDVVFRKDIVFQSIILVSRETCKNPLLDHINAIEPQAPDPKNPVLDTWLIDHLGATDTDLTRAYSRRVLISILARITRATIQNPVKVDTVLVLYGGQGIYKSTSLQLLCFPEKFGKRYFSDTPIDMSSKDAIQQIQGKMVYELKELAKRSKDKEVEKAFIDSQIDRIRLPYSRIVSQFPRRTVFIATTNQQEILSDATGSRRFWPVEVGVNWNKGKKVDLKAMAKAVPKLWAIAKWYLQKWEEAGEAGESFEAGQWWLTDTEEDLRNKEESVWNDAHPLTPQVLSEARQVNGVLTITKILERIFRDKDGNVNQREINRRNKAIVKDILLQNHYVSCRIAEGGKVVRAYRLT